MDLCHAVQNLRKYSYITISTLPHVTCVKCNAIAAVDMKTMLDTILLLELELNNQNLANDLDYFDKNWNRPTTIFSMFIEMWRNNGYLGAFISSTKKKFHYYRTTYFFPFLGTFFIFLYFMDASWVLDLPSWRSCTVFCIKIKAQPNFGEIVWNKKILK